jgi:inner membrane transporter RhtA
MVDSMRFSPVRGQAISFARMGFAHSEPLPPVAATRLGERRAQTRALALRFGGSAPLLVVAVSLLMQLGAALAAKLFADAGVVGTLWLRTAFAAAILAVAFRGKLRLPVAGERVPLLVFAAVLAAMNVCYFEAIDRAPLGLVSTVEFLGPLAVAVAGTRGLKELGFVGLAGLGVLLLGSPGGHISGAGLALALGSAACWAVYLVLGRRLVLSLDPASTLALSSAAAAIILLPAGVASAGSALTTPHVLLLLVGVAAVGNALPYLLELLALRLVPAATYGVLLSLEPAVAALVGLTVLGQGLSAVDVVAIGCVVAASAGASRVKR